ncbi:hypothetical protein [Haloactinomyces albus]|uniref:PPE family protein n=1 Tax=Haloactinomyces albus TaxID=1352928 RepID=A0AAE3ZDU2_9ACTN|nr:hypothetical protein [Haloactinomyces albus]MDR7301214.1 hypothetical protein [Haloactinomyces albus]
MTSAKPEYGKYEYIANRERQAYVDAGGVEAHQKAVSDAAHANNAAARAQRAEAKTHAAQVAAEYGQQQAKTLSEGHQLWDKPSALGATHYLSYSHKELARFVRENFDPVAVHDVGRYYGRVGNDLVEFSGRIRQAAMKTEESWKGTAGDAMRTHVTAVSDGMGRTGEAAQLTANQLGMQAEAGERARNAMPEEVEVDTATELKNNAQNPDPVAAQQQANALAEKQEKARVAHAEAAQVVSTMESDFGTAAASTPKFAPPPPPPGDDGGSGGSSGGTAPVGGFTSPAGSGGSAASTYSASAAAPSVAPPASGGGSTPPLSPAGSGTQAPAGTSPSWAKPGSSLPPGAVRGPDGTVYRQDPRTGQWMRQNPHNGRWAPVPPGQQVPGGGRAGGGVAGGGRPGGGFGPRGSAPGTPMAPGGRSGSALPGSPTSGTPAAGTTSSSSSARGGRMPMGAMGGQNQQGGDEEEHERKYVLDNDDLGDELGLPRVAPPVLGALPDEDGGH